MANMQPAAIPPDRKVTQSERALFDALESGLSQEFWVYHSLPFIEPERGEQGEADFVILHPRLGMLVIECKGYGVRRLPDGTWVREHHGRTQKLSSSPTEQAAGQVRSLINKLSKPLHRALPDFHGSFPLVYGWALAFPFTRWSPDELPPEFEPELLFDADALNDIGRRVQDAYAFYRRRFDRKAPPSLSDEEFRRFRLQVFSPEVDLAPNLAGAIEVERNRMLRLTEDQAKVVRLFMENTRLRVRGAAGTGKTVLAQHGASLLAREGKRVLLLCFNKNLRDHLRESVATLPTEPGEIHVTNFHSLCSLAHWKLHNRQMDVPADEAAATEFWVHEAPLFVLEALDRGALARWDAVIVDEGQDFAEPWWSVLEECVVPTPDAKIVVFYDEAQTIFDHGASVPNSPAVFPLYENFRNTRRIAEAVSELGVATMHSHSACPDGEAPSVYEQPGESKTRRMLGELVADLVSKQRLRPDQIVLLTPRTAANSSLGKLEELGGVPVVHNLRDRPNGVLHMSISAFKGLESDTVILADINPDDERCDVHARYVAASRASHRLYVFQKGNWQRSA